MRFWTLHSRFVSATCNDLSRQDWATAIGTGACPSLDPRFFDRGPLEQKRAIRPPRQAAVRSQSAALSCCISFRSCNPCCPTRFGLLMFPKPKGMKICRSGRCRLERIPNRSGGRVFPLSPPRGIETNQSSMSQERLPIRLARPCDLLRNEMSPV